MNLIRFQISLQCRNGRRIRNKNPDDKFISIMTSSKMASEIDSFTTLSLSVRTVPTVITASNMTEYRVVVDINLNTSLPTTQNSYIEQSDI
jgi:alcohol dehydrogenase class IV